MPLNPPKQYISPRLLATIVSLLSGMKNVAESDQLGRLCEKYGLDEYFLIELEVEGNWSLILTDSSPQESPLWEMMDKYVLAYQNDELEHSDIQEGKEGLYHPINASPFNVSMEATRGFLSQQQQEYGNKFCINFFENPLPSQIRWLECLWYLMKTGEIQFDKGQIVIDEKKFHSREIRSFLGLMVNDGNEVFYQGKKIKAFTSRATKQLILLKLLIEHQGTPLPRETVYEALKLTPKSKKAKKTRDYGTVPRLKGTKLRESYADRLESIKKAILKKIPSKKLDINTTQKGVFLKQKDK